jgi:hypothetical protein
VDIVTQAALHGDGREAGCEGAWPLPSRCVEWLALESRRTTWLYWSGVGLVVASLFVTHLLPCVDYPQHLALSDAARRLFVPGAPEHREYELNFFTYNGLFHLVVAALSTVLPIELAGRLVVAASIVATAGAMVALLQTLRRPPSHAALFTPILFSFSLGWGFVNYVMASAIVAWTLVFVARAAVRPRVTASLAVAALGLACSFAHVLAMLILCAAAAALGFEVAWRATPPAGPTWLRLLRVAGRAAGALAPLLVGCLYCVQVYQRQYVWDPNMYRDPTIEGSAPPLWQKVAFFGAFALDLFGDATDSIILWIVLGVMGWAAWMAWKARRTSPPRVPEPPAILAPFAAMTLAYFATPMVLIGTHLIFPRLGQWLVFGAVLATPRFPPARLERARGYVHALALVAGVNLLAHCVLFGLETNDASAVIDDLPPGQSVTAVIWDPWTYAFRNGTLTHLAAYYGARKHGQWAFAFARYLSVPVRFRPNSQPAWPQRGWEFDGEAYDARCKYARAFPFVIVKAPEDVPRDARGEAQVRRLVFKQDAAAVALVSHHGRFWAFDARGLPEDGAL